MWQLSRVRTSTGMFLNRAEDEVVGRIEARIAKHTAIPATHGEGLQILHYQVSSFVAFWASAFPCLSQHYQISNRTACFFNTHMGVCQY